MAISTGLALLGGTVLSGVAQSRAASKAASAQTASAQAGIEEQRRQFEAVQALLAPFVQAGTGALAQQSALVGLGGADAQTAAIRALEQGPEFQALTRQGEEAILQSASATGGLRGGNIQAALAQFRPQILSGLIEQQYSRLGGLATSGQNAAAGVGTAGMTTGANVSNLMAQQGAARAGSALAGGRAFGNVLGDIGLMLGRGAAYQGMTPAGGGAPLTFGQAMLGGAGGAF
jgi:hypothetical protein